MLANAARTAVVERHFKKGADPEQFAHELYGVMLMFHHASRLLRNPHAAKRARTAFESLLEARRASSSRKGFEEASSMAKNSTTVRSRPVPEQALRAGMQLLSAVSPGVAGAVAEQLFMRPPPPRAERRKLVGGDRFAVQADGVKVAAWSYGEGPPVYLLHGWAGHAGQLRAFVDPLVKAGRRAVLFDAPAHGDSTGWQTSILRFALALEAVAEKVGTPAGVAHSMGGSAAAFAHHRGLPIDGWRCSGSPRTSTAPPSVSRSSWGCPRQRT